LGISLGLKRKKGWNMGYLENLERQWQLTANEKKVLEKLKNEVGKLQEDRRKTYRTKNERRRKYILKMMLPLREKREGIMKKIRKRRRRALFGK
jgi:hypothetical protein